MITKEFEEIYREYYSPVYAFLLRLTGGDALVSEELAQETFFQAFLSIHRFRGKCTFFTWLCQIAKNSYFKYIRKHKEYAADFSEIESLLRQAPSAEAIYEAHDTKEALYQAISNLRGKQKDILMLRVYFDCSFREIGLLLNMKENTVKVTYHRAKERLKKQLALSASDHEERTDGRGNLTRTK